MYLNGLTAVNYVESKMVWMAKTLSYFSDVQLADGDVPLLSAKTLKIEQPLTVNQGEYDFDLRHNSGIKPNEKKLLDQELFLPLYYSIKIRKEVTDRTTLPNPGYDSNHPYYTYPEANVFNGVDAATGITEAASLYKLYNGYLEMHVESKIVKDDYYTGHSLYRPELPYMTATQTGNTVPTLPGHGGELSLEYEGFVNLHNFLIIRGNQNNIFKVKLGPGDLSMIVGDKNAEGKDNNLHNIFCLQVHGISYRGNAGSNLAACMLISGQ